MNPCIFHWSIGVIASPQLLWTLFMSNVMGEQYIVIEDEYGLITGLTVGDQDPWNQWMADGVPYDPAPDWISKMCLSLMHEQKGPLAPSDD